MEDFFTYMTLIKTAGGYIKTKKMPHGISQ